MIDIDRLKRSLNIVDVIEGYLPLKKTGKHYQACCPFHSEKSPSFMVNDKEQFYHCFGCGEHGDVIGFIQEYCNVEFIEAVKMLGGEVDQLPPSKHAKNISNNRVRLPLGGEPHNKDEINNFIFKCEHINNNYFYGREQLIVITDIYKNPISIALYEGKGFEIRFFKKEFIYGSCVIIGDINNSDEICLCEDYSIAKSNFNNTNGCTVCFFQPKNLHFIVEDLKRLKKKLKVVATSEECEFQADHLNLKYVRR